MRPYAWAIAAEVAATARLPDAAGLLALGCRPPALLPAGRAITPATIDTAGQFLFLLTNFSVSLRLYPAIRLAELARWREGSRW
jgi:hypothetical protein